MPGSQRKYKTAEQGAATTILAATSPQLDGVGGRYFEDCNQAPVRDAGAPDNTIYGVAAYAIDPGNANWLREMSLQLLRSRGNHAVAQQAGPADTS